MQEDVESYPLAVLLEKSRFDFSPGRSWAKLDYESQRQAPTLLEFGDIGRMK